MKEMFCLCSIPPAMGAVSCWMSVPSACLSAHFGWLLLPVSDRPASGERAEDFEVPQPGRGWKRAVVGQNVLSGRCCGHKSHQLTCRHELFISALSQPCENSSTSYKASFPQSLMQAHLYTMLTPWSHGMIKVGKDLQHQVCPTILCIFLPTFSVSCKFF